jgi:hypothetical protein
VNILRKIYLVGGLEHFLFFHMGIMIPTDFHIFQRGRAQPPTSFEKNWGQPGFNPCQVTHGDPARTFGLMERLKQVWTASPLTAKWKS